MIMEQAGLAQTLNPMADKLELLRQRINDENYLCAAIQRLALVMSNELMEFNREGGRYERKRRK
ncbi:MAG: hypothetical protein FWD26_08335 [Treponema sp.]|nr:hypothetical protein [Treponema sp.]